MDINTAMAPVIQAAAEETAFMLSQIAKLQRFEDSPEARENTAEAAQLQEEIDATHVEAIVSGTTVSFSLITSGSMFDSISTEGQPVAYSGGTGGTVTYPDEHTEESRVKPQLWNQPVPESEDAPSMWKENYHKMAKTLASQQLSNYIHDNAGQAIAPVFGEQLQQLLGGGS